MPLGYFRVHGSDFSGAPGSRVFGFSPGDMATIRLLLVFAMVMPQACPPFPPSGFKHSTCPHFLVVFLLSPKPFYSYSPLSPTVFHSPDLNVRPSCLFLSLHYNSMLCSELDSLIFSLFVTLALLWGKLNLSCFIPTPLS